MRGRAGPQLFLPLDPSLSLSSVSLVTQTSLRESSVDLRSIMATLDLFKASHLKERKHFIRTFGGLLYPRCPEHHWEIQP